MSVSPSGLKSLRVNLERLKTDILALSEIGSRPEGGITRHAFDETYEQARAWLRDRIAAAELHPYDDQAGNTFGRLAGAGDGCVLSGSHIDTVPNGGPLDGAYGVLAALEVARTLNDTGLSLPMTFEVCAFVEEEGRYLDCLGVKALSGELDGDAVHHAADVAGNRLADAMKAAGFHPDEVGAARRHDVTSYVEIHIEQGPVLEHRKCPIGIVQGIAGIRQCRVTFTGQADHAGTTPTELRHDALAAAMEYAYLARQMAGQMNTDGNLRFTIGDAQVTPGAANVVPSKALLLQEIRDLSDAKISETAEKCAELAEQVAQRCRVAVTVDDFAYTVPVTMSDEIQNIIREVAGELNHAALPMPSGAGHDAQVMAKIAPSGMIFVPSIGGRSHCPEEWTTWEDLEIGANVLLQTVIHLIWQDDYGSDLRDRR